jgi:hypothetical protein
LELRSDGTLVVRKKPNVSSKAAFVISAKYDLSKVVVTHMASRSSSENNHCDEIGIVIKAQTMAKHTTQLRIILTSSQQSMLYTHLRNVTKEHNLDNIRQLSITEAMHQNKQHAILMPLPHLLLGNNHSSTMRSTIATAMDFVDAKSKKEAIIHKRGALQCLPVLFSNDLVHGSW